jgi:hypothetical protein
LSAVRIITAAQKNLPGTLRTQEPRGCLGQMAADVEEDVEKEEYSSIAVRLASLCKHSGNQSGGFSENYT